MKSTEIELIYELSPMQQAMLFHTLYAPGSGVYVLQMSLRLTGRLDLPAFEQAWRQVVERHAILRTAFFWENLEKPLQVVYRQAFPEVARESWSGLGAGEQRARLDRHLEADRERGLDLSQAPLMRLALFELGPEIHQLVWTQHHLVVDGWSQGVILRELFVSYAELSQGREPRRERPRGFRDYIAWLQRQEVGEAESFWRQSLAGLSSPTLLAEGDDKASGSSSESRREGLALPRETTGALREVARRHRLTLNTLVQGAWAVLLAQTTGRPDVVFGATVAGRPPELPGVESIVGPFINTLPVRVEVAPESRLRAWLGGLQERLAAMRRHEHSSLVDMQRWSELPGGVPLFDHILVFENLALPQGLSQQLPGLTIEEEAAATRTNYPLNVVVIPGAELALTILYNAGCFETAAVTRLLERLAHLLTVFAEDLDPALAELPALPPAERQQLLEWNDTGAPPAPDAGLHELFAAQAERTPEAVALVQETERTTYAELAERAGGLARQLRAMGVGPEVRVAVCLERSPDLVASLLGVLAAGGAYVPVDPAYPAERQQWMLEDSGAAVLVTRGGLFTDNHGQTRTNTDGLGASLSPCSSVLVRVRPCEGLHVLDLDAADLPPTALPAGTGTTPDHLAYVIYTSGSTGRPKGVAIEHRSAVALAHWARDAFSDDELSGVLAATSACFDLSVFEIFAPLAWGGRVILAENALALPGLPAADEVRLLNTVPSVAAELLRRGLPAPVRTVCLAGEPLPAALAARLYETGTVERVLNLYGPSEDTTYSTGALVPRPGAGRERAPAIGRPLPGTRTWVVDHRGELVPIGVAGELWLAGAGLARGYLDRPELTAERFTPDPFGKPGESSGQRVYRTGDLVRHRPDGDLEYLGRLDDQIKIRGFRIEPGEITAVLARHPEVRECTVQARRDPPGDLRLVAYVVGQGGRAPRGEVLRAWLQARLPQHMVPSAFVALAALPLSPNGKLDRRALPAPERTGTAEDAGFSTAPAGPVEELLARIWSELLGVERIGVHESFFALGGHSLLATQVISRIRTLLGAELPLRQLFETPTIADLARAVRASRHAQPAPPVVPVPREELGEPPLSFAQQRLWLLDQIAPGNPAYNVPWAVRLSGALDVDLLERCFGELARRHEGLRTTFAAREGGPVQVIAGPEAGQPELPLIDLSDRSDRSDLQAARQIAREEAVRPFDLARGPLLRLTLVRLTPEEHLLLLTLHHVIADGWSMGVLVREAGALYAAFSRGEESPLPPLPVQPADFAVWQREWLQGEVLEEQLTYWRDRLEEAPRQLELPADRPRTVAAQRPAGLRPVALSADLAQEVAGLSRSEGLTPFMTLLAAFGAVLGRLAGQDDLLLGSPIANRNRQEIEGLIGFFVNTLVLRMELGKAPAFRELLAQVRQTTIDAYAHQDLPFERLVEEIAPDRDARRAPLVQVLFALQNAPLPVIELPGLTLRALPPEPGAAKFDLVLTLQETGGRLAGALEYDADLFDAATIDRLLGCFETLLAAGAADPGRETGALPLLSAAGRHQALVEWNDAASAYPRDASLPELFAEVVRRGPDAPALLTPAGDVWTYRRLDEASTRLASRLRTLGVGPETAVGLSLHRSPELIASLLAILKAGGIYVPLDAGYPDERLAFMLADTGAGVVLVDERNHARMASLNPSLAFVHPRAQVEAPPLPKPWEAPVESLALVIYTSGSTGRAKGVALTHRGIVRLVRNNDYLRIGPGDRMALAANISFDAATLEIWGALLNGAALVLLPREAVLSPADLAAHLRRHQVTTLFLTTALFNQVAREEPAALGRLRTVMFGGEAADPAAVARALSEGRPERLLNLYGPAESTTLATWHRVREVPAGATAVPIGLPIDNSTVYVLDPWQAPVPPGVVGELYVGGDGLARGYLNRPELTAERFVPHPWSAGDRLYRTGDLVRQRPGGAIEFVGRGDGQVKIRGFRIETAEIEAILAGHPDVRECALVARREAPGELRLVAYTVLERTSHLQNPPAALRLWLQERLPGFMVPAAFVLLEALPLTPNGKLDRRALPAPERAGSGEADLHGAPADPVEELLAGIWSEVLKLDRVGARDDFFALGGHSLLATQVVSRIRGVLGVDLPLRALFETPTIAGLAQAVRESRTGRPAPPIVPVPRDGDLPLSFAQQRLWFLDQLEPGNPAYNIPVAVRLTGAVSGDELARIFAEVVRRHEALRTTFAARDGRPVQVIAPELRLELPVLDLAHAPEAERDVWARELALEEARRPFDLQSGPLLRLGLLRLGEADHLLLVTMHHIVSDGWSMGVLLREIALLYAAFAEGKQAALPDLPVQYADFAAWQREWLQGEVLEAQLGYWKRQLAGAPRVLELPLDRPRPAAQTSNGALVTVDLSPALSGAVRLLCRGQGVTPFMALLAAWSVLLGRHAGQDDVLVGSPVAGRTRREIEGLIGFFVNTVVFRSDFRDAPAFGELLERVRQVALDGYAHQDVPFERIVDEVVSERDLAVSPLFQALFALQNAPVGALSVPGLTLTPLPLDSGVAKFDLSLTLGESPAGFSGALEYNTDLFDGSTAERLWSRFLGLLEAAAGDPDRSIADLPLLLPAEGEQLLRWNDTGAAPVSGSCLHELFAAQVERTPEAVALVHGTNRWTYAELAARAGGLARHLRTLGVGPEVRVAVCLERSPDLIAALLGVLAAGGAYVPIDPAYPAERQALMLEDSGAAVLVTRGGLAGGPTDGHGPTRTTTDSSGSSVSPCSSVLVRVRPNEGPPVLDLEVTDIPPAKLPADRATPNHLAYLIYTSGSTGRPKGVAIEHRSAVALAGWARGEFSDEELSGVLAATSVCFDLSVFEIFVPLAFGGTILLAENALELPGLPAAAEVRLLNTVPSAAAELVRSGGLPASVRTVCLAGEPLPAALAARLYATWTVRRVLNLYGPSEDTTYSTGALVPRDSDRAPAIGRPIRGTRAHVVDRRGQLVPPGVAGELWLAGDGLARGYLSRPELTAERFTPDPFGEAGRRVYRTGDLVRFRPDGDGNLDFLGRIDHQVKLRGFRIELGEIEAVLASAPAVRESVVQVWGDAGDRRLVAWVTLDPSDRTDPSDHHSALAAWLRARLPEYMVPAAFVVLDALPLSPNGKVDRRALPAPDRARRHRAGEIVAPRTRTEEAVAEIWKELLALERVSVDDAFFELGGNSLLATQVLARVRQSFGIDLPLREIFKRPTIAGLAELIDAQTATPADEDELAELLAELDLLSDEEARERLQEIRALESES